MQILKKVIWTAALLFSGANERRTQAVNKELEISASVSFVGELHQKTRKILQFHKFII